jgi:hypothetical protein
MVSTIADTPRQHRSENKLESPFKTNQLQISVRNYGRFQIAIATGVAHGFSRHSQSRLEEGDEEPKH